jgi:hypothetical protein
MGRGQSITKVRETALAVPFLTHSGAQKAGSFPGDAMDVTY